jgi:two-component system response regulator
MNLTAGELADVLLVEDDPGDALLIQESFGPADSSNRRCHVASHSDEALRFVRRAGEFADAPRPRLILLDLNLGETHGLEILAELKGDADLLTIPVVVLSSSRHPTDIGRSYALHANGYIVKPVDLDDFASAIKTIDACFLGLIEPSPVPGHQPDSQHPVLDTAAPGCVAAAE